MLNAFRHHRGGHWAWWAAFLWFWSAQRLSASQRGAWPRSIERESRELCSTPFGITEGGMARPPARGPASGCAQRLSASQRGACAIARVSAVGSQVLNAFRHHRGGHHTALSGRTDLRSCAQRLSASQRGACLVGVGRGPDIRVCSTPFGITEGGIRRSRPRSAVKLRCSTPFGITEGGISGLPYP